MLKTITIDNFRTFQHFELHDLGRLNLLVGTNNCGKTTVLEAIQLLCSRNNPEPFIDAIKSRGERFWDDRSQTHELDIRHLFHHHSIEPGSQFTITGVNENGTEKLTATIGDSPVAHRWKSENPQQISLFGDNGVDRHADEPGALGFYFEWQSQKEKHDWNYPLSYEGGLSERDIRRFGKIGLPKKAETKTQFITSAALTAAQMTDLFDQVVLTPEETFLHDALQTIEPRIERIASVSAERNRRSEYREGFVVRLSDHHQRVPIGSMGDGIWRMLGLALATVGASDGVLFVDEIDTGLHFSAMSDMWKLLWETAKRLNVQVFATTHSNDCWTSLSSIAAQEDAAKEGISIQRIEKDKKTSIAFSEEEIVMAAKKGIEVR
jgi:hypothetical protein